MVPQKTHQEYATYFIPSYPTFELNSCAAERQRRASSKLLPILEHFARAQPRDRPVLITLTVRSSSDPLAVQDKDFKAAFRRLRRSKHWKDRISGAVCGYEFTLTPAGWHYHAHILAFRRAWYEQEELAHDWENATRGTGQIADIRQVSSLKDGFGEVLGYCFKPADLDKWAASEVQQFQSMRRTKLSDCFGGLRGLRLDEYEFQDASTAEDRLFVGCPCPDCGEPLQKVKVSWRELNGYTPLRWDCFVKVRAGPELVPRFAKVCL